MSADPRKALAYEIAGLAQYYGRKLEERVLGMMVDDLADLPLEPVLDAFKNYRRNPKNRFFPLPAQIREIVAPEITPEAQGREIAASIQEAVVRFGYPNGELARAFLGHAGWEVVKRFGGWAHLCQNLGVAIDITTFHAQARQLAEDTVRYSGKTRHLQIAPPPRADLFIADEKARDPDIALNDKKTEQIKAFQEFLEKQQQKDSGSAK